MRVLLTGGAGFIGRHVLEELLSRGHEVRVFDSLRSDVHADGKTAPLDGAELRVGDVRDAQAVESRIGRHGSSIASGSEGLDSASTSTILPDYASSNDFGTAELLACMARKGIMRLTMASSMVVYGEGMGHCVEHGAVRPGPRVEAALSSGEFEPPCPICTQPLQTALVDEASPLDPRNAYATSKVAQEFYASNWARITGGSVASLRYHNVYGPGMPRDTPYAGVAAIFTSALRRGEPPRVL